MAQTVYVAWIYAKTKSYSGVEEVRRVLGVYSSYAKARVVCLTELDAFAADHGISLDDSVVYQHDHTFECVIDTPGASCLCSFWRTTVE